MDAESLMCTHYCRYDQTASPVVIEKVNINKKNIHYSNNIHPVVVLNIGGIERVSYSLSKLDVVGALDSE